MDNQDRILNSLQKIQSDLDFIKQKSSIQDPVPGNNEDFKTLVKPKDSCSAKLDGNIETI